jgi:transposase
MGKVSRVKPPLTLAEIDERLNTLHDFWRLRRCMVIRHALVAPAPAQDIACRLGLSGCTVRALIAAYNRHGPDVLTTPGQGRRQHASLAVEEERPVLAPLLADSQAGQIAGARRIKKALADSRGHPVATRTIYRLLPRPHWRTVVPRPHNPRRRQAAQDALKNPFPP